MTCSKITFVLIIVFYNTLMVHCTRICGNQLSCANELLVDEQDIYALGYKSLSNASVILYSNNNNVSTINSDPSNILNCEGAYSCNKIVNITNYDGSIECDGDQSCSDSKMNLFATGNIECDATNSCRNSKLQTTGTIKCRGSQSCTNSFITNSFNISSYNQSSLISAYTNYDIFLRGHGFLSLYNSIIYMSFDETRSFITGVDESFLWIRLYGHLAGYNSTIICNGTKQKCLIRCRGNGCFNASYACINGATCFIEDCNESKSIDCPNELTNDEIDELIKSGGIIEQLQTGDDYIIGNINDISNINQGLNLSELMGINYVDIGKASTILDNYCNLEISLSFDSNSNIETSLYFNVSLTNYDYVNNISNGSICCRASYACDSMRKIELKSDGYNYSYSYNYNYNYEYNGPNIFCGGRQGCSDVSTIIIDSNISSLYCLTELGCDDTKVYFTNSNNYNYNYNYNSNDNNNNNNYNIVYCGSDESCEEMHIYNANKVFCDGSSQSCKEINTFGVNEINFGSGVFEVGKDCHLYSRDNKQEMTTKDIINYTPNTMTINFFSFNSGSEVNIHCSAYDNCIINCLSNNACQNDTIIYCYGNCNLTINCDETIGLSCPVIINVTSDNPTAFPSEIPSLFPSLPTDTPTDIPTIIPTVAPSYTPTNVPTCNRDCNCSYSYNYNYNSTNDNMENGNSNNDNNKNDEINSWLIVGLIVTSSFSFVMIIIVILVCIYYKRKFLQMKEKFDMRTRKIEIVSTSNVDSSDDDCNIDINDTDLPLTEMNMGMDTSGANINIIADQDIYAKGAATTTPGAIATDNGEDGINTTVTKRRIRKTKYKQKQKHNIESKAIAIAKAKSEESISHEREGHPPPVYVTSKPSNVNLKMIQSQSKLKCNSMASNTSGSDHDHDEENTSEDDVNSEDIYGSGDDENGNNDHLEIESRQIKSIHTKTSTNRRNRTGRNTGGNTGRRGGKDTKMKSQPVNQLHVVKTSPTKNKTKTTRKYHD